MVTGIETDRGPFAAALMAAGYQVFAVNPLSVSRYRDRHSVSGAKPDPGDAKVLADLVRTDRHKHRPGTVSWPRRSRCWPARTSRWSGPAAGKVIFLIVTRTVALLGLSRRVAGLRLIVAPSSVLRWHRDILRRRWARRSRRGHTGRPRTRRSIRSLVLRLARGSSPGWRSKPGTS